MVDTMTKSETIGGITLHYDISAVSFTAHVHDGTHGLGCSVSRNGNDKPPVPTVQIGHDLAELPIVEAAIAGYRRLESHCVRWRDEEIARLEAEIAALKNGGAA